VATLLGFRRLPTGLTKLMLGSSLHRRAGRILSFEAGKRAVALAPGVIGISNPPAEQSDRPAEA
jgi:hypothetical protein